MMLSGEKPSGSLNNQCAPAARKMPIVFMIVAVTVYATVWPILINTIDGVRHIEQVLIQTGRSFGLSKARILWQVILPAASPYIVTGLRIGLSIALILVTTAEMVAGSKGLGFFILDEERSMNSGNM